MRVRLGLLFVLFTSTNLSSSAATSPATFRGMSVGVVYEPGWEPDDSDPEGWRLSVSSRWMMLTVGMAVL